jgi:glucose/galactose transporter
MALPSSYILKKTGFKNGMSLGLFVMAVGSLLFIPASNARNYYLFLFGLFIQGTGLTILQTASNPYITILGPIESAAKRISIMGICNKVAGILSPIILGAIVLEGADKLEKELLTMDMVQKANQLDMLAGRVIWPYVVMAIVLVVLALVIRYSPLPNIEEENDDTSNFTNALDRTSILHYPQLVYGVIAIFLYVGAEVIAGDTIGNYGKSLGISMDQSRFFPSLTLTCMLVGYVLGILTIPKYIKQETALKWSAIIGILFSIGILFTKGYYSVFLVASLGLANALMWPAIWPLAISGLGRHTKTGSALLIMGIVGGAILPPLYGKIGELIHSSQMAYLILIPCYVYILWYATARFHKKLIAA